MPRGRYQRVFSTLLHNSLNRIHHRVRRIERYAAISGINDHLSALCGEPRKFGMKSGWVWFIFLGMP